VKTDQDVKADRNHFQRHENHHKIIGRGGEHHPRQRQQDNGVKFADAHRNSPAELHAHQDHKDGADQKEPFEKERKAVLDEHSMKTRHRGTPADTEETDRQNNEQSGEGDIAQPGLQLVRRPQINQEDRQGQPNDGNFQCQQ